MNNVIKTSRNKLMDQQFSYLKIIVNQNKNLLFSGCGGNKNRFYSYEECSQKCIQQISPKRPGKYSLAHKKTRQLHNDGMWDHLKKERLINQSPRWKIQLYFNPTRRGAFKAQPEQKWQFKHLLVIQLSRKKWLFPEPYGDASHTLFGAQNSQKGVSIAFWLSMVTISGS